MEIDWLKLWWDLIVLNPHSPDSGPIKRYKIHAHRRQERPDSLLDLVLQSVDDNTTVLDIGAGNGRWAIPLAGKARSVTAIDPDKEMLDALRDNIKAGGDNIQIIQSSWEDASVETHDIVTCAHAMYSSPDLASFVRKMEQHARKACYLSVRLPPVDGIIGELSNAIYHRFYDSVNAVIAYNALYSMGIYTNVMVEKDFYPWVSNTLDEACLRAKRHLRLESNDAYDGLIRDTLKKRLTYSNNCYIWPDGMRSVLLWWHPSAGTKSG
jgi:FkbM family methyltransferase